MQFWHENDEVKPMNELVTMLENSIENNINLLLNVPPDKNGQIPEKWINPLMELKHKIKYEL